MINIYTKTDCPYCVMAKRLMDELSIDYNEINIELWNFDFRWLAEVSWMLTVPQIFVWETKKENLIWWYDQLLDLHNRWELLKLIKNND